MVDLKLELALGWKIKYHNCVRICINDTNFSITYSIYPKWQPEQFLSDYYFIIPEIFASGYQGSKKPVLGDCQNISEDHGDQHS